MMVMMMITRVGKGLEDKKKDNTALCMRVKGKVRKVVWPTSTESDAGVLAVPLKIVLK